MDTPLHLATENGFTEIIEYLLQHKANTDLKNQYGLKPISCSIN